MDIDVDWEKAKNYTEDEWLKELADKNQQEFSQAYIDVVDNLPNDPTLVPFMRAYATALRFRVEQGLDEDDEDRELLAIEKYHLKQWGACAEELEKEKEKLETENRLSSWEMSLVLSELSKRLEYEAWLKTLLLNDLNAEYERVKSALRSQSRSAGWKAACLGKEFERSTEELKSEKLQPALV